MSRHCRKKPTPRAEVKPNKIPLWWKIWLAIEDPLYYLGVGIWYLLICSFPFVVCWLIFLMFIR